MDDWRCSQPAAFGKNLPVTIGHVRTGSEYLVPAKSESYPNSVNEESYLNQLLSAQCQASEGFIASMKVVNEIFSQFGQTECIGISAGNVE